MVVSWLAMQTVGSAVQIPLEFPPFFPSEISKFYRCRYFAISTIPYRCRYLSVGKDLSGAGTVDTAHSTPV